MAQFDQTTVISRPYSHVSSVRRGGAVCQLGGPWEEQQLQWSGAPCALPQTVWDSQQRSQGASRVASFILFEEEEEGSLIRNRREVRMRTVPGLSLLVTLVSACSAFNLDTENFVRKSSGDPDSLFGFSMAMHRQLEPEDKTMWALNFLYVTRHRGAHRSGVIQESAGERTRAGISRDLSQA